ncbi:MAG: hypothetical protein GY822_32485 [Deltaproteobacteria bacterium]|nr:hypothetical protein [Deltaproteobacteria bacterium]
MEELRVGDRVLTIDTLNSDEANNDNRDWWVVEVEILQESGVKSHATLLRTSDWVEHEIIADEVIPRLLGVEPVISQRVVRLQAADAITDGTGQLVLGVYRHLAPTTTTLILDGAAPIVATGDHPVHSASAQEYVRLDNLQVGESVSLARGTAKVVALVVDEAAARFTYDIEVEDEHHYFVGDVGVRVHNNPCDDVDLSDAKGRKHILEGDGPGKGGGHRAGTGKPGKSEFPSDWSDSKIMNTVSDIATDPSVKWSLPDHRGYITGSRAVDGVNVKVVFDTVKDRIVSGFPTNLPKNPK